MGGSRGKRRGAGGEREWDEQAGKSRGKQGESRNETEEAENPCLIQTGMKLQLFYLIQAENERGKRIYQAKRTFVLPKSVVPRRDGFCQETAASFLTGDQGPSAFGYYAERLQSVPQ